jgi:hypothetical protein
MTLTTTGAVTPPANPSVTTSNASAVDKNTATIGGSYTAGTDAITETGVEYKKGADPYTALAATGTATPFTVNLSSLTASTQYTYKAYAKTASGTFYGAEKTFTTLAEYTLTVSVPSLSFVAAGEQKSFGITSNTSWAVSVPTADAGWCSVNTASGSNNATIDVTVAANTGTARSTTITISGAGVSPDKTVAISQAAAGSGGTVLAEWDFSTLFTATTNGLTTMASSDGSNSQLTTTANSGLFNAVINANPVYNYVIVPGGWNEIGKAWVFEIPVTSFTGGNVNVSFTPQSSNTGPRDFAVEWSANGSSWSTASAAEQYQATNSAGDDKTITLTTSGLTNKLYIRFRVTSLISVRAGVTHPADDPVQAGGTSRFTSKVTVSE